VRAIVHKHRLAQRQVKQVKGKRENRYVIKVMNEHREGGRVLWSARTKGCPKPFNWSIINLTLYLFITYKCKAGLKLKWNTGY
jgi:hypothetical protein